MPKPSYILEKQKKKPRFSDHQRQHKIYVPIYRPKNEEIKQQEEPPQIPNSSCEVLNKTNTEDHIVESKVNENEVLLKDFKFTPQSLVVTANSVITWRVDKNEPVHESGVYASEPRGFVILIHNDKESFESDVLKEGQIFSHKFEKPGTYQISCAINREIRGIVKVCDEREDVSSCIQPVITVERYEESPERKRKMEEKARFGPSHPLMLLQDFDNEKIRALFLELSLRAASVKKGRETEEVDEEAVQEQKRRYEQATAKISVQTNGNIYENLVSREFNGIKIGSMSTNSPYLEKKKAEVVAEPSPMKPQESEFQICFDSRAVEEEENKETECLHEQKEQEFGVTVRNSEEIEEKEEKKEDAFLAFLKAGIKQPVKEMKKQYYKSKRRQKKTSFHVGSQDLERISAMKAFLANRFEIAEVLDS